MPLVQIQVPELAPEAKQRIGERVIGALHEEGLPASSVVVRFLREEADLYLEGGLFFEAPRPEAVPAPAPVLPSAPDGADFLAKARRNRQELGQLRDQLEVLLRERGGLSSLEAQALMGLKACEWAPATLRRLFGELEADGLVEKRGQRRGTRYIWKEAGPESGAPSGAVILVKRGDD